MGRPKLKNPNEKQRKEQARYATKKLIAEDEIDKPGECEICGAAPAECHHIDYADPRRVMWLCTKHHRQTHSQFAKPAPLDWMADIRAAMKRIDAERARLRAAREAASSGTESGLSEDR